MTTRADTGAVSGYNADIGVVKDAQSIVPEPDVNLSELTLSVAGSTTTHSYTGADGNTFSYTITYPHQYLQVVDAATAVQKRFNLCCRSICRSME